VAGAILITLLVLNNQQQQRDAEADRQRAEQAESTPPQHPQQPPIVIVPGSQPAPAAPPAAAPAPPAGAENGKPSNAALEASVTARLLEDPMLGTYPVDVKTDNGVVTLSGDVPTQMLKQRAARVARSVNGVTAVVNNITVKQ
jgi:hyperosmotically inducible protein